MIALINARGGSKGIPQKNKKILKNKPLIEYSIDAALQSKYITQIFISTDDNDIIDIARAKGINMPYKRPDYLATDSAAQIDVIKHSIEYLNNNNNFSEDFILLQPTCPLRSELDINKAIEKFETGIYDTVVSVTDVGSRHPATCYLEESGFLNSMFSNKQGVNRQKFSNVLWRNGSIYIFSQKTIKNFNSIFGKKIGYIMMPDERSFNLDSMFDWEILEAYLNYKK